MTMTKRSNHTQPRLIHERKPLRPVRVLTPRPPVAVTNPVVPHPAQDQRPVALTLTVKNLG